MQRELSLKKREFAIDLSIRAYLRTIKEYESGVSNDKMLYNEAKRLLPIKQEEYRKVVRERCGWRSDRSFVDEVKKNIKGSAEWLQKEILRLEAAEAHYKGILSGYREAAKAQEAVIEELKIQTGSRIGYQPNQQEISDAQDKLLAIHREAGVAQAALPDIQNQLDELRKRAKAPEMSFSEQGRATGKKYASPSLEIDARAKEFAVEYGVTYTDAVRRIMKEDPFLAEAYMRGETIKEP